MQSLHEISCALRVKNATQHSGHSPPTHNRDQTDNMPGIKPYQFPVTDNKLLKTIFHPWTKIQSCWCGFIWSNSLKENNYLSAVASSPCVFLPDRWLWVPQRLFPTSLLQNTSISSNEICNTHHIFFSLGFSQINSKKDRFICLSACG